MADIAQIEFSSLLRDWTGDSIDPELFAYIAIGASGRSIMRGAGHLGVYWTAGRADNAAFVPAAHYLLSQGVQVPRVLVSRDLDDGCGVALVEDLGECSLLDMRDEPWEKRSLFYRKSLRTLYKLHQQSPSLGIALQAPFDFSLYRWEQEYFAEHYWARHRGRSAEEFLALPALAHLAVQLSSLPMQLVHRDFQSQNIMIHQDEAYFIDFQGMRMGRGEYDLASLIFDPYADLSLEQRDELLTAWEEILGEPLDSEVFLSCALQRLMQAMGAFANIGYNQGKTWYIEQIPAAERALRELAQRFPQHELLTTILS